MFRPKSTPTTRQSLKKALSDLSLRKSKIFSKDILQSYPNTPRAKEYFGDPLPDDISELPPFIELAMQHIERHNIEIEGIFRITPNMALLEEAEKEIKRSQGYIDFNKYESDHVASGILKLYFRKLPDPLCTAELYNDFIAASATENPTQRIEQIQGALTKLPFHRIEVMKKLVVFLQLVTKHSPKNRMDTQALATVFAPCILKSQNATQRTPTEIMAESKLASTMLVTLIEHAEEIFGLRSISSCMDKNVMSSSRLKRLDMQATHHLTNVLDSEEFTQEDEEQEEASSNTNRIVSRKSQKWK